MAKPKLGLGSLTDDQIIALANTIKTAMTGNANFTTPNPTLASIGTAITTAQTKVGAYNTAKAAAETALADREAAIRALSASLTQEAAYVENVTGGDKVKIESAGMSVRADGAPITMTQVLDLAASEGDDCGQHRPGLETGQRRQELRGSHELQRSEHRGQVVLQIERVQIERDDRRFDQRREGLGACPRRGRQERYRTVQ